MPVAHDANAAYSVWPDDAKATTAPDPVSRALPIAGAHRTSPASYRSTESSLSSIPGLPWTLPSSLWITRARALPARPPAGAASPRGRHGTAPAALGFLRAPARRPGKGRILRVGPLPPVGRGTAGHRRPVRSATVPPGSTRRTTTPPGTRALPAAPAATAPPGRRPAGTGHLVPAPAPTPSLTGAPELTRRLTRAPELTALLAGEPALSPHLVLAPALSPHLARAPGLSPCLVRAPAHTPCLAPGPTPFPAGARAVTRYLARALAVTRFPVGTGRLGAAPRERALGHPRVASGRLARSRARGRPELAPGLPPRLHSGTRATTTTPLPAPGRLGAAIAATPRTRIRQAPEC